MINQPVDSIKKGAIDKRPESDFEKYLKAFKKTLDETVNNWMIFYPVKHSHMYSLPLNSCGRLAGDVQHDAVDAGDLVDNSAGNAV